MRISDWSSDVCSSDLIETLGGALRGVETEAADLPRACSGRRLFGAEMRIIFAEQMRRRCRQQPRRRPVSQIIGVEQDQITRVEIGRASSRDRVCTYV